MATSRTPLASFLTSSRDHCGSRSRGVCVVVGTHHIVAPVAIATEPSSTHTAADQDDDADDQPEGEGGAVNHVYMQWNLY